MAFLEIKGIHKVWDTTDISLDFSAEKETLTTIVGPSGSGKSTALRIIAGLLENDGPHSIKLDGTELSKLAPGKRGLGLVFQNSSLFLHMTALDNVAYGLAAHGMKRKDAREKAYTFLETMHIEKCAMQYPETLSGGEAQRVALARTLIIKPSLLLLDEPLSALDAPLRKELASEIRRLQREFSFTAVMVTHDLQEARNMSDRIILLKDGHKAWEGNAADFSEALMSDTCRN